VLKFHRVINLLKRIVDLLFSYFSVIHALFSGLVEKNIDIHFKIHTILRSTYKYLLTSIF